MHEPIPQNIDQTGGILGGMFKTRNAGEAAIAILMILGIFHFFLFFIPTTIRFVLEITIAGVTGVFFLIGINNQPVSIAILDTINFRKTRCVTVLRKPMPDMSQPAKRRKFKIKIKKRR
ncbi:hypothetical protein AALA24_09895 [Anaerovoracaceae bacterium 42-11]